MNKKNNILIIIFIVLALLISSVLIVSRINKTLIDNPIVSTETIVDATDLSEKMDMIIDNIANVEDIEYSIIDNNVAILKYNNNGMDYELRITKDVMQETVFETHSWGTPMNMDTICDDGKKIRSVGFIDTLNLKVMKTDWIDNHKFYTLITYNLNDRSEFLQEANRIIYENHNKE